ncbi:hypothetical protein HUU05_01090 [candidate division KSB1 bacterium]|nr:hypothetical protein [candidate division KSB1 bacterium]
MDFDAMWERREVAEVKDVLINLVALDDLLVLKRAAGRKVDLEDAALLEKFVWGRFENEIREELVQTVSAHPDFR